jgi:acetyl-CoA carboxylase biotin carboxyl carrier protein
MCNWQFLHSEAVNGMVVMVETSLPGSVWKVLVHPGVQVAAGDPLFILEVMKTEVPHTAPVAGTVRAVYISEGDAVDAGERAIEIA